MIPKKIHYCWFSGDPYPDLVQECIASWHKHMPDWEFVLWDYEKVKDIDSLWLKECLQERKWAFAADFVRLWAVYHEGGVYLDSDVKVFKSLDDFLSHSMFIGREGVHYCTFDDGVQVFLTSHCFGAEALHPFLKLNLEYYENRHFIRVSSPNLPQSLKFDTLMMPYTQSMIAQQYGYDPSLLSESIQYLKNGVVVYPSHYFGRLNNSRMSHLHYVEHLGQGSWREAGYNDLRSNQVYTIGYKVKWRVIHLFNAIFKKCGYCLFKIKIDGYE